MKDIEVDQIIYVNRRQLFTDTKPNLQPFVVTKVNKTNFYARSQSGTRPFRFHPITLISDDPISERFVAYLTEEEYWQNVKADEEKVEMVAEIKSKLDKMSNAKLRKVLAVVNEPTTKPKKEGKRK